MENGKEPDEQCGITDIMDQRWHVPIPIIYGYNEKDRGYDQIHRAGKYPAAVLDLRTDVEKGDRVEKYRQRPKDP